jgi:hypothetical protein
VVEQAQEAALVEQEQQVQFKVIMVEQAQLTV